jgi:hypothetical protein
MKNKQISKKKIVHSFFFCRSLYIYVQSFNAVPLRIINGIIPRNPRSIYDRPNKCRKLK